MARKILSIYEGLSKVVERRIEDMLDDIEELDVESRVLRMPVREQTL